METDGGREKRAYLCNTQPNATIFLAKLITAHTPNLHLRACEVQAPPHVIHIHTVDVRYTDVRQHEQEHDVGHVPGVGAVSARNTGFPCIWWRTRGGGG